MTAAHPGNRSTGDDCAPSPEAQTLEAPSRPEIDGFVVQASYSSLFREVVLRLREAGIPVMPLKGILLAFTVYDTPSARLRGDIDILVPEHKFQRALDVLGANGFASFADWFNGRERVLRHVRNPIEVDLHRGLFALGRFRLTPHSVFSRGAADSSTFSVPVVLPDPYDTLGHLIGHAAADHGVDLRSVGSDIERVALRYDLDPRRAARHLDSHGLGRATRFIFTPLAPQSGFAGSVLKSLRLDAFGDTVSRLALSLVREHPPESFKSRYAGYLINTTLPQAAYAGAVAAMNRIRVFLGAMPL